MASLGLTLHLREIVGPWRRGRLVVSFLVTNLVLVPAIAVVITRLLSLDEAFETGILLLGIAAGAPFVPKLIEIAKSDVALSVSLMLLQILGTILVLPWLLPLLIPGVKADAFQIATPLVLEMLVPLVLGLLLRHFAAHWSKRLSPILMLISQLSAIIVLFALFLANLKGMLSMLGSGAMLAALFFVVAAMGMGYLCGLVNRDSSVVQCISTGQRNIPAALVVASSNPMPGDVVGMLMLTTFVGLIPIVSFAFYSARRGKTHSISIQEIP